MTDESVSSEKTLPPSPNPNELQQMVNIAMSGKPEAAAQALAAAGVIPQAQVDAMIEESKNEQMKFAQFAAELASMKEAIRWLAHANDGREVRDSEEFKKLRKDVVERLDKLEDMVGSMRWTLKKMAEPGSDGSKKVTTSGTQPKVT